jgi:hypothetical protein
MTVTTNPNVTGIVDPANLPQLVVKINGASPMALTDPIMMGAQDINNYVQIGTQNKNAGVNASSDHICYANNNANDTTGFIDMGYTSSVYAQATYACTGPNDAYIFGSGVSGASKNSNLVIWTDSTGLRNDIIFGTNGFTSAANERFRIKKLGQCKFMPLAAAPTDAVEEGDIYYNSTLHKLQVRTAAVWETITSI